MDSEWFCCLRNGKQQTLKYHTLTKFLSACIIDSLVLNRSETDEGYRGKSLPQLCLCLSQPMEFMTGEYFDCSISLKHLTGFQALGALSSQSLDSLLLLFQLLKPVCSHRAAVSSYACPNKKAIRKQINMGSFLSLPPGTAQDNTTQLDRATPPLKDPLCKRKMMKTSPAVLKRPPRCHSTHTLLENGISSNLTGKLVHLWDRGIADLRWKLRAVKTHAHVMLKSILWHLPLGKENALGYAAMCQTLEASPMELESWWSTPHVPTTLNNLTELWFFGPAIKSIISRGRSLSLKQISIPL